MRPCSSFLLAGFLRFWKRSNPATHHLSCAPRDEALEYLSTSRCVSNIFKDINRTNGLKDDAKDACKVSDLLLDLLLTLSVGKSLMFKFPTLQKPQACQETSHSCDLAATECAVEWWSCWWSHQFLHEYNSLRTQ